MNKNHIIKTCLVFCLLLLAACNSPTETQQPTNIFGTWQMKIRSGGFAGIEETLDVSKKNHIRSFKKGHIASYYYNDSLQWAREFYIQKEMTNLSDDSLRVIHYETDSTQTYLGEDVILYLTQDTLILAREVVDAFTDTYTRLNNSH